MLSRILFALLLFSYFPSLAMDARFQVASFYSPDKGCYAETYLLVSSRSVQMKLNKNRKYQGALQITLTFEQGDSIRAFDKYVLKSPEIDSVSAPDFKFIDLQRFLLKTGTYTVKLQIRDLNDSTNKVNTTQNLVLNYSGDKPDFSDVELLARFEKKTSSTKSTKAGYELIPLISNFYGKKNDTLRYYVEAYIPNNYLDSILLLRTFLESKKTKELLDAYYSMQKIRAKGSIPLLGQFPLEDLSSGEYALVFELRNAQNEIVASRSYDFQRLNRSKSLTEAELAKIDLSKTFVDTMGQDRLRDYTACLRPQADENEKVVLDELVKSKKNPDADRMRRFIYTFWANRNPTDPAKEWMEYHKLVILANKNFGNRIMRGYETERGRVFLQYGPPNSRTSVDNEPNAYPYEIWWYYSIKKQNNVRFVFYNPDLVSNDYQLIHSEAFSEPFNPQFKLLIYNRTNPINNVDQSDQREHFGTRIDQIYRGQ